MVRDGSARGFGSPTLSCHEVCTVGVSSCTRTIWQTSAPAVNFQKGPRARPRWFLHTAYATKNRTHTHTSERQPGGLKQGPDHRVGMASMVEHRLGGMLTYFPAEHSVRGWGDLCLSAHTPDGSVPFFYFRI